MAFRQQVTGLAWRHYIYTGSIYLACGFHPAWPGACLFPCLFLAYTPPVFHIVLYQPEIPPNTGNIIRLCANTGAALHLIHPLGFELTDRRLRRAGLDYAEFTRVRDYSSLSEFLQQARPERLFAVSTRGEVDHTGPGYRPGDAFLFGPETRGLPAALLAEIPPEQRVRIPMQPGSRSLNLSNAVAVILYEALRQTDFSFDT